MSDFKCNQIRQTSSTGVTVLDVCTTDEFSNNTVYINVKYIPLAAMLLPVRQYFESNYKIIGGGGSPIDLYSFPAGTGKIKRHTDDDKPA